MREFDGVFIPVPTPYKGDAVATDRLKANLERWNETGLGGYVILGSTGEFPMLSEAERDAVLATAREAIPRDKAFIAGTGTNSTLLTIRQTKRAAELGADAAIVITPHYFTKAFSQAAAQTRHYLAVAEASPIPVMLYNFPLNTGINLGSAGGILALAVIAAREFVEVYALATQGRWEEAKEIAARMIRADRGVPGRYGIGGLKAALDLQGFYGGPCRAPLGTPDGDAIDDIKESLVSAGLL